MSSSELTADDARRMSSRLENKHVAEFERLIKKAAENGEYGVPNYCHACGLAISNGKVVERCS